MVFFPGYSLSQVQRDGIKKVCVKRGPDYPWINYSLGMQGAGSAAHLELERDTSCWGWGEGLSLARLQL